MSEYKAAKEAFVSDNPGSSIWSINAVSIAALSCYSLYAQFATRRDSPLKDYALTILPLLLSITLFSIQPILLNAALLLPIVLRRLSAGNRVGERRPNGQTKEQAGGKRSKGQWLDESDSDEEPAQPALASPTDTSPNPSLPSELLPSPIDKDSAPPTPNLSPDPGKAGKRAWRKRHSPTPSTHTHTAIDILPTPETAARPSMDSDKDDYPTRTSRSGGKGGDGRLPFLSVYRAHMMVMTIHCILAVDFPVFPRWFGKCEDFGTSLMDVGVGSFVFSLGIVSTKGFAVSSRGNLLVDALFSLRKSTPVLLLGCVRVLMVKGTEYPEHVTEYGVHWNFFFTLGLLPFVGTVLAPLRRQFLHWTAMGSLIAVVHQTLLQSTSLQSYVLSPHRVGLLGMNKEGLVSLTGYLAIYLLGLGTGEHIGRASSPPKIKRGVSETEEEHLASHYRKRRTELAMELFGYSTGWWTILALCRWSGIEVSRRLANSPYVIWIAAYNSTFLLGYLLIELACFPSSANTAPKACPALLEAINANGLAIFLAANLLTGLVNVSIQTMYAGTVMSMGVLGAYSVGVCSIAWVLRKKRLKL